MVTAVPTSLCFALRWLKKQTTLFAWRSFRFETGMWPWRHEKTMRLFCKTAKIDDAIIYLWELEFVAVSNSNGTIILITVVTVHQCLHVVFLSVRHLFLLFSCLDKPKCFEKKSETAGRICNFTNFVPQFSFAARNVRHFDLDEREEHKARWQHVGRWRLWFAPWFPLPSAGLTQEKPIGLKPSYVHDNNETPLSPWPPLKWHYRYIPNEQWCTVICELVLFFF